MLGGGTIVRVLLACCLLAAIATASARGADYLVDEMRALLSNAARIDELTSSLHTLTWMLGQSEGNGFHLIDQLPDSLTLRLESKSVAFHPKHFGIIYEDDDFVVDGQVIPSAIKRMFPDDPVKRQMAWERGLFGMVDLLPEPHTSEDVNRLMTPIVGIFPAGTPEELVIWGRDELDRPKALKILRNELLGGTLVIPRDFYREVDQLPADGSETIFEYRVSFTSDLDFGGGVETVVIPFRCVVAVSVSTCVVGGSRVLLGEPPALTHVDAIPDPAEDLCPSDTASWFLPDDAPPRPEDEGELCFDVDHIGSLDLVLTMAGTGLFMPAEESAAKVVNSSFPGVLEADFDTGPDSKYRAYMAIRCLLNRGFRIIDTNNPATGAAVFDTPPLTHGLDYAEDYDGVPFEIGFQTRYVYAPGLGGRSLLKAIGGYGVLELLWVPLLAGNYTYLARDVHFYVDGPGGTTEVMLRQLLQLIQSRWNKAPAYVAPHDLLRDHPRIDLGESSPLTFEIHANLYMAGRFRQVEMIVSAYPGLYSVNVYGGDPFE